MQLRCLRYLLVLAVFFSIAFLASSATFSFFVGSVGLDIKPCFVEGEIHGNSEPENTTK